MAEGSKYVSIHKPWLTLYQPIRWLDTDYVGVVDVRCSLVAMQCSGVFRVLRERGVIKHRKRTDSGSFKDSSDSEWCVDDQSDSGESLLRPDDGVSDRHSAAVNPENDTHVADNTEDDTHSADNPESDTHSANNPESDTHSANNPESDTHSANNPESDTHSANNPENDDNSNTCNHLENWIQDRNITLDTMPPKKRLKTQHDRNARDIEKHPLLPPCTCRKKCHQKILEERRKVIHQQFWEIDYNFRRSWIFSNVTLVPIPRPRLQTAGTHEKKHTRLYKMSDNEGKEIFVCKIFFLSTIGYTSDKVLTVALSDPTCISPKMDKRGCHEPENKMSADNVTKLNSHIKSFNPYVSHYRREHAPNRLYLPPELTVTEMYNDFKLKNPDIACYETYRKAVRNVNISFAKLGQEECETCQSYEQHKHENQDPCEICQDWRKHIENAKLARKSYQEDCNSLSLGNTCAQNCAYFSVDMQKVMLLPRLPGIKSCMFTRRLVIFHETFAPLGGNKSGRKPLGVIWHEGISGRNAGDVASAYVKVLRDPSVRDFKHFVFWVDNCSAQNKNWTIFTALVAEVNSKYGPESITIKYLEKGHTFMSADAFHAKTERGMRMFMILMISRMLLIKMGML